jgi:hypothetical protein
MASGSSLLRRISSILRRRCSTSAGRTPVRSTSAKQLDRAAGRGKHRASAGRLAADAGLEHAGIQYVELRTGVPRRAAGAHDAAGDLGEIDLGRRLENRAGAHERLHGDQRHLGVAEKEQHQAVLEHDALRLRRVQREGLEPHRPRVGERGRPRGAGPERKKQHNIQRAAGDRTAPPRSRTRHQSFRCDVHVKAHGAPRPGLDHGHGPVLLRRNFAATA